MFCFDFEQKARAERAPSPDVTGGAVPRLHCPSLQHFREHFLLPQRPVILEGVVDHWPCMRKWRWVATSPKARPHGGVPKGSLHSAHCPSGLITAILGYSVLALRERAGRAAGERLQGHSGA